MIICDMCGKEMKRGDYYTFKNNHSDNLCKECRCQGCSDDKPWTYFQVMKYFDIPYIESEWLYCMRSKIQKAIHTHQYTSVFDLYFSKMRLKSFKDHGFEDSFGAWDGNNQKNKSIREFLFGYEIPKEYFEVIEKYKYKPLCPIGCTDCVNDPAYIYAEEPEWYKELYGDKKPEEVIDDQCKPFIKNNVCYGYDNEDK